MPPDFLALAARVLAIVAPVFLTVGLGHGWGRRGRAFDTEFIGMLVFNFGAPARSPASTWRRTRCPSSPCRHC